MKITAITLMPTCDSSAGVRFGSSGGPNQGTESSTHHKAAMLYIFEDNEAVIKMIIKGRSPTMRHVSRTHRVVLDWLCDRINLDSKIQIKYIDTMNHLADILTKGNFTRDE